MSAGGALLRAGDVQTLGSLRPRLRFGEEPRADAVGRRLLYVDERPAFELSWWCGTCPFLFQRLDTASETVSLPDLGARLTEGLDELDDGIVSAFGGLLPEGGYLPLLLSLAPALVAPVRDGDYFAGEQVATWGIDAFWGLPQYPATPYYRTFETPVDPSAHLYEFVVPMVPPSWNDRDVMARHAAALASSDRLTAVAVSTLDVCAPAVDQGPDWYTHWCLTHFLLDGHHKLQAAAETGRPLRLLSLLSVDGSLASADQLARLPGLRGAPRAAR